MEEQAGKSKKVRMNRSRESSKRSRQVNEQETEDYLKRPVSKISNPNKDLKNAYGKRYLEDPKFSYIHKLKEIRKTGEDSVSEHGDTDDQDFDLNQLSAKGKKRNQPRSRPLRQTRRKVQRGVKKSTLVEKQSGRPDGDQEKLEKEDGQRREEDEQRREEDEQRKEEDKQQRDEAEKSDSSEGQPNDQNKQKNQINQTEQQNTEKDDQQSNRDKPKQAQDLQKGTQSKDQYKMKQEQSDSSANEQNDSSYEPKEEQKASKSDQSVQIVQNAKKQSQKNSSHSKMDEQKPENKEDQPQSKSQKSNPAEQQNIPSSEEEATVSVVKVQIEKKSTKKKGKSRKKLSIRKNIRRITKSLSKKRKPTKEKAAQPAQQRKNSQKKVNENGKAAKISGKSNAKLETKAESSKQQQSLTERVRTRKRSQMEEQNPVVESQRRGDRSSRLTKSRIGRKRQPESKGETGQSKTKARLSSKIKEDKRVPESSQFQPGQQNLDKYMQKGGQSSSESLKKSKATEKPVSSTITMQMSYLDFQNALKQQTSKAVRDLLQQRRKSLKISSKIVVESLLCFDKSREYGKAYFRPKGHRYEIKVDQSSDEEHQFVVPRRSNRGDKHRFKRYRKVVVEGSRSEDDYPYASGRKHRKQKHREEGEDRFAAGDRSKHKKRNYRQVRESSESVSSSEIEQKDERPNQGLEQVASLQRSKLQK